MPQACCLCCQVAPASCHARPQLPLDQAAKAWLTVRPGWASGGARANSARQLSPGSPTPTSHTAPCTAVQPQTSPPEGLPHPEQPCTLPLGPWAVTLAVTLTSYWPRAGHPGIRRCYRNPLDQRPVGLKEEERAQPPCRTRFPEGPGVLCTPPLTHPVSPGGAHPGLSHAGLLSSPGPGCPSMEGTLRPQQLSPPPPGQTGAAA